MTNEELVARIQQGNTELIHTLWDQVERFVWLQAGKAAKRAESGGVGFDLRHDLYHTGYIALQDAIPAYNAEAGKNFIGYYSYYLRNHFSQLLYGRVAAEKYDMSRKAISLDAELVNDEEAFTLHDIVSDPAAEEAFEHITDAAGEEAIRSMVQEAINTLTEEERAFYRVYLKNGLIASKACKELRLKYSVGDRLRQSGSRKIKQYIKRNQKQMEELDWIHNQAFHRVSFRAYLDNLFTSRTEELAILLADR